MKSKNLFGDSMMLSLSSIINILCTMGQGMILTRTLTKSDYGTYSQVMLILIITNSIIGLGMNNAINYFIPRAKDKTEQLKYVNTIFTISTVLGGIGTLGILFSIPFATLYFKNPLLPLLLVYAAIRPILTNVVNNFINLYVANGQAGIMARRNTVISMLSLTIMTVVTLFTKNLGILFICLTLMDLVQCLYFHFWMKAKWYTIKYFNIDSTLLKEIMTYAIPLAIATAIGTLTTQMDTLIIGGYFPADKMAVYAATGRELPFAFIASSIITVVRPFVTKAYQNNDIKGVTSMWSSSIEVGILTTWTVCFAGLLVSPELLRFVYTAQYMEGLTVFRVYIITQMLRFTFYGMVLNAAGKTKIILIYSIATLTLNLILNIVLINLFGFNGPAFATLISIFMIGSLQFVHSAIILNCKINSFFIFKSNTFYLSIMLFLFVALIFLKNYFLNEIFMLPDVLTILIFGSIYCFTIFYFFYKKIKKLKLLLNFYGNL